MEDPGASRRIRSGQSLALADLLQSAFVAELVLPSIPLWISSPWIGDVDLIDNSARQFAALCSTWPPRRIRLTEILRALLDRGGQIVIVTIPAPSNADFMRFARDLQEEFPVQLTLIVAEDIHEKGICGEAFSIDGSMNLTYNGVQVNEEYVIYTTRPAEVAERRLEFRARWEAQL